MAVQKTPSIFPHWLFKWRGPADAWLLLTFRTAVSDAPVLVTTPDICSCSNDVVPIERREGTGIWGRVTDSPETHSPPAPRCIAANKGFCTKLRSRMFAGPVAICARVYLNQLFQIMKVAETERRRIRLMC